MASQTGVSITEARATQRFQSPISTPPRSATDFHSQPPTQPWATFFQNGPPFQPPNYGLLFGPVPGQQTQIHDMAASEISDADYGACDSGLDTQLQLQYIQDEVELANEREREAARAEYALNQHRKMLQSIDQSHPVHSLLQYPPLPQQISGTEPSPHQLFNILN